jgi:hypothetical protein
MARMEPGADRAPDELRHQVEPGAGRSRIKHGGGDRVGYLLSRVGYLLPHTRLVSYSGQ